MARAGREALGDPLLARAAGAAAELALDACRSVGPVLLDASSLRRAERFFETYAQAGRTPADDVYAPAAA